MKTFVVAYMNFFDNDLTQEVVTADTPEQAFWKHSKLQDSGWESRDAGNSVEEIREYLFGCDILSAVIEIATYEISR